MCKLTMWVAAFLSKKSYSLVKPKAHPGFTNNNGYCMESSCSVLNFGRPPDSPNR